MSGRAINTTERQMSDFFEQTVYEGHEQLLQFAKQLERALSLEAKVEIKLKGYTSPLTASDYNNLLAKRRISSVENFLMQYNDGALLAYLQNGYLQISELPLGETQVSIGVSDNPKDRRNSVYSIKTFIFSFSYCFRGLPVQSRISCWPFLGHPVCEVAQVKRSQSEYHRPNMQTMPSGLVPCLASSS